MFKTKIEMSRAALNVILSAQDEIVLIGIDNVREIDPDFEDRFSRYGVMRFQSDDVVSVCFVFGDEDEWVSAGLPVVVY